MGTSVSSGELSAGLATGRGRSRRHVCRLAGGGAMGLAVLAATRCGTWLPWSAAPATSGPPTPGLVPATVQAAFIGQPADLDNLYRPVAEAFMRKYPQMRVELELIGGGATAYQTAILTRVAGGGAPDVIHSNHEFIARFMAQNVYQPLDPLIRREKVDLADYFPSVLDNLRYRGKLYALPQGAAPYTLLYNKDLFDKAGARVPDETWTLDAFTSSLRQLTRVLPAAEGEGLPGVAGAQTGPQKQWGGFVYTSIYNHLLPWVAAFGGELVDTPDDPKAMRTDGSRTAQAIQWLADLYKQGVIPTPPEAAAVPGGIPFFTGQAASWFFSYTPGRTEVGARNFAWDVAPPPRGPSGRFTSLLFGAFGLATATKVTDQAWAYLQYLASAEAATASAAGALPPARKSVARDVFLRPGQLPAHRQVIVDAMAYALPSPRTERLPDLNQLLASELADVWLGSKGVKAALDEITRQGNLILKGG